MRREPITEERLERALVNMAHMVIRHGTTYAPFVDKLERELREFRSARDTALSRAQQILEANERDGDLRSIR